MLPVNGHSDAYYQIHPLQGNLNVVQTSMAERPRYSGRNKLVRGGDRDDPAESRIYFAQIAAIASAIFNQIRPAVTVTSTVTALTTRKNFECCYFWREFFNFSKNKMLWENRIFDFDNLQHGQFFPDGLHSKSFPVFSLRRKAIRQSRWMTTTTTHNKLVFFL